MANAMLLADQGARIIAYPLRSLHPVEIRKWAFTHPLLTANSDRQILSKVTYLQSLDKRNLGGCYASNRNLAKRCGLSKRTVQRSIDRMLKLCIITIKEQWTGGAPGKGRQSANLIKVVGFPVQLMDEF